MVAFKIYLEDKPRGFADQLGVGVREKSVRTAAEEVSLGWGTADSARWVAGEGGVSCLESG